MSCRVPAKRRKLVDKINSDNHWKWKRAIAREVLLLSISWLLSAFVLVHYAISFGRTGLLLLAIPISIGALWIASQISTRHPQPGLVSFHATNDTAGFVLGGAGITGGAAYGAIVGSHIGLALGPLGAIAGTIPGAIIGGVMGLLGAVQVADTAVTLRDTRRFLPSPKAKVVGTVGLLAGAAGGAWYGAGVGLALGPLGAIAGTIPGAIIGATICGLSGVRAANYL